MRMVLKAQSQCRATLKTLATIKNPPVVFARQANIAQGPQQVNNEMMRAAEPRAREDAPNKLLEEKPHERLDFGTPRAAVGADTQLATVGTFDRANSMRPRYQSPHPRALISRPWPFAPRFPDHPLG
jgi:hypothetical protein